MQVAILLAAGLIGSIGVHASNTPATVVAVITGSADHSNLASAVTTNDLVTTLSASSGTFTVFAPTNAVMPASFPKTAANTAQLKHHVMTAGKITKSVIGWCGVIPTVAGKKIKIMKSAAGVVTVFDGTNTATVTAFDLLAGNGVVHVIDKVLTVPTDDSAIKCPPQFVVDAVSNSAAHSNLHSSLQDNALEATLKSPGPFTLFAPTNTAMPARLTASAANKAQLKYHALSGKFLSSSLSSCAVVATAQGKKLKVMKSAAGVVTLSDGTNTATVTTADIDAGNGVVHSIDKVLTVPADDSGLACPTTAPAAAGAFQRSVGLLALVIGTTSFFF